MTQGFSLASADYGTESSVYLNQPLIVADQGTSIANPPWINGDEALHRMTGLSHPLAHKSTPRLLGNCEHRFRDPCDPLEPHRHRSRTAKTTGLDRYEPDTSLHAAKRNVNQR